MVNPQKLLLTATLAVLSGCASVAEKADFSPVQQLVDQRIGAKVHWKQGTSEDVKVEQAVRDLRAKPLSLDAAVQLALLNNPRLQAEFEELGIAQADLVQAGLLENPVFGAGVRFSDQSSTVPNVDLNIVQNFLNILTRPARQQLASGAVDRARLQVGGAVLTLAADVQKAYYRLLSARQIAELRKVVAEAAEASFALAQRFDQAGNITELTLAREKGAAQQAQLEYARVQADILAARAELTHLLGLTGADSGWEVAGELPEPSGIEAKLDALEALAVAQRQELTAAQGQIQVLARALAFSSKYRFIGGAAVGVDAERESDGETLIGPNFSIELPIFDQRQASIARLEAEVRRSQALLKALELEIRGEVRTAFDRVAANRQLIGHYNRAVIPTRERIVELLQQEQNFMLLEGGVFEVLQAKQQQVESYREYLETVRDYWLARADLQRAIGGRLPANAAGKAAASGVTVDLSVPGPQSASPAATKLQKTHPHPNPLPEGEGN